MNKKIIAHVCQASGIQRRVLTHNNSCDPTNENTVCQTIPPNTKEWRAPLMEGIINILKHFPYQYEKTKLGPDFCSRLIN